MSKPRVKKDAARIGPQTRDEVVEAIAAIGRAQRECERIQATMNDQLAKIRQTFEELAQPHREVIEVLSEGVHTWCSANRLALTDGGKTKSVSFPSGEVKWRITPPACSIKNAEKVLQQLQDLGLDHLLRTKTEIDKTAILANPDDVEGIKGITITQREEIVIEPFETKLEEAA